MIYKEGVSPVGLHWRMRKVLKIADRIWQDNGRTLVVTATAEDGHGEWSWHPYGCAVDLRTRYFDDATLRLVCQALHTALGKPYQMVLHEDMRSPHMHIEFDPVAFRMDEV